MGDPYERVKGGRLSFKGGGLACISKSIDKKKNKKKNKKNKERDEASEFLPEEEEAAVASGGDDGGPVADKTKATATSGDGGEGEIAYTIDAAKRMKYDQLFPVEAKKFGYDPNSNKISKSVEDALDDRVKKKADRYCK